MSVVTKFNEYKKFNVRSILDPPVKGLVDQRNKFAKAGKKDDEEEDKEDKTKDEEE